MAGKEIMRKIRFKPKGSKKGKSHRYRNYSNSSTWVEGKGLVREKNKAF